MSAAKPLPSFFDAAYSVLRGLLGEDNAQALFDALRVSVRVCYLDTNAILGLIHYAIRKQITLPLLMAQRMGGVRLMASVEVRDEVPEKILAKCPREIRMDPEQALSVWQRDFVPAIEFLDPSELPLLSLRVKALSGRDPDDLQSGQLIELLHPHAVYSNDLKHLSEFEILGEKNAAVSIAYLQKSQRDAVMLSVPLGGHIVLTLSMPLLDLIANILGRLDRRIRGGMLTIGLIGLALALLHPTARRWLLSRFQGPLAIVSTVVELYAELELRTAEAEQTLLAVGRGSDAQPQTACWYAARVLGRTPAPLGMRKLTELMVQAGYKSYTQYPHHYVARVLRQHPLLFEEVEGRRWRLRSHVVGG
jgi:hypothetical protein